MNSFSSITSYQPIHRTFQEPSSMTQTLDQLENRDAFIDRHIGPDSEQLHSMLNTVGAESLDALTAQIVPADIQLATPPAIGP